MFNTNFFPLLTPPVFWTFLSLVGLLLTFQIFAWLFPTKKFSDLKKRLIAWWIIFGVFALLFLTRNWCITLFWMGISYLALKEYFQAVPKLSEHKRVRLWLYLSLPIQYLLILTNSFIGFLIFIPVYVYLCIPVRMIIAGTPKEFLHSIGTMFWGIMMMGYSLSYIAFLSTYSTQMQFEAGPLGLVLYLLILTEINDASQYIWGKLFGKRKIVPLISPKKTYEGCFGGILTTIIFAALLSPFLTPTHFGFATFVGILVGVGGFLGDVTMSALKRDVQIKDFGRLLPGHGGLLDRIDSLIFTAPLFFYLIYWKFGYVS
ncbi:MAG: phosphatidate cytidylyltransferase [Candidatus Algichlamydia australiensis]|nr:phosphatidate cytidylyltransferase [Chlamydiales bacterium]